MAATNAGQGAARLDVITIGRVSVDLYGQQIGSRLEDMASFAKSVGGCPANIAIGTARLGLRSGAAHPRRQRADWAASSASRWRARASRRPASSPIRSG